MRGILLYPVALLLLSGCVSNEADRPSTASVNPLDTLDIELPEGIRQLDNLTVYSLDANAPYDIQFKEDHIFQPGEVDNSTETINSP